MMVWCNRKDIKKIKGFISRQRSFSKFFCFALFLEEKERKWKELPQKKKCCCVPVRRPRATVARSKTHVFSLPTDLSATSVGMFTYYVRVVAAENENDLAKKTSFFIIIEQKSVEYSGRFSAGKEMCNKKSVRGGCIGCLGRQETIFRRLNPGERTKEQAS